MKHLILFFSFVSISTCTRTQTILNDTLNKQLESIYEDDQTPRLQLESIQNKYATDTAERKAQHETLWKYSHEKDTVIK